MTLRKLLALALPMAWMAVLGGGCSEKDDTDLERDAAADMDAGTKKDASWLPDGYKLWPCKDPGRSCNAHDTCAINPVCGQDGLCWPSSLQNCDDGLECTVDTCAGLGVCSNKPKSGTCALAIKVPPGKTCKDIKSIKYDGGALPDAGVPDANLSADGTIREVGVPDAFFYPDASNWQTLTCCFKKGERKPDDQCLECVPDTGGDAGSPSTSSTWQPASGGSCDDANLCTKTDVCVNGICKGTSYLTQCADSYTCTEDLCDGVGGCKGNPLKKDWCLINGTCYKDKAMHPGGTCYKCDVSKSQSAWTAVGTYCMISNKCYAPGDKDSTNCSICDPTKSTTAWTPLPGLCKISNACYKDGAANPSAACAACDTKTSTTSWTVSGSYCYIGSVCKNPKDKDTTGCGECDPTKDKYAWSTVANTCLIDGKCYADKYADPSGCLICDYAKNPKAWTPVGGTTIVSYTFETGTATGWTLTNSSTSVGWVVSTNRPFAGYYSLYYGNPTTKNYDDGSTNNGTATAPPVTLTASKKAALTFMLYMDTESYTSYDTLKVWVAPTSGTTALVWEKDSTQTVTMKSWMLVKIDLSAYAGQSIQIKWDFDTVDSAINSTEGVYIDDITIYHGC